MKSLLSSLNFPSHLDIDRNLITLNCKVKYVGFGSYNGHTYKVTKLNKNGIELYDEHGVISTNYTSVNMLRIII